MNSLVSFPINRPCYSFETLKTNSLFEQNKGLLILFNISVLVEKNYARIHLLAVSTSSCHWRWQQTQLLLFKAQKCRGYVPKLELHICSVKVICQYRSFIAAEITFWIKIFTFQSPEIQKFYLFFFTSQYLHILTTLGNSPLTGITF